MKSETVPMTQDEMTALMAVVDEKLYWKALFTFAKTTGRRLGEIYAVKVRDIDFDKGLAMTDLEKARKFKRVETIITPDCLVVLKRYIRESGLKADDYLFRAKSYRQIQARIKSFAKKAGITHNVTFHNFRHYFITELVRKGWAYDQIRKLTGHTNINIIMQYDHVVASDLKDKAIKDIK